MDLTLTIALREMTQFGKAWRHSWGDFDGRTLRSQLSGIEAWAKTPNGDYHKGSNFFLHMLLSTDHPLEDAIKEVAAEGGYPDPEMIDALRAVERAKKKGKK